MIKPSGSWVAMPLPFSKEGDIDFGAFKVLVDRQIKYGTNELFVLGSAAESTLLTVEEKKLVVKETIKITKGKIPVFFGCPSPNTKDSVEFAKFCETEGADGVIFTIPPYLLISQASVKEHLDTLMGATKLPCGIYNNPSRVGVNINPDTIIYLADKHENFVVDKEAMPDVAQLIKVKMACKDKLNILCCDFPKYSIVIPTLAIGGNGTANIGGNIIPEEVAKYSRPWTSVEIMNECKEEYFKWYPLLEALYHLTNPIVVKAALNILGLPAGYVRKPYLDYAGPHYEKLELLMREMGVIDKYSVK